MIDACGPLIADLDAAEPSTREERLIRIPVLARQIAHEARCRGFAPVIVRRSHTPRSPSCYLHLTLDGQRWLFRVSDHVRPEGARPDGVHFDLVSRDGLRGAEIADEWLSMIERRALAWWDTDPCGAPKPPRPLDDEEPAHELL
jgi:hypothetical protein